MILTPEIPNEDLAEHLDWYLANFEHVDKLYCGSDLGDGCGELLALIVYGGSGHQAFHPNDMVALPVGSSLFTSRVRIDETRVGDPMLGFVCSCGNDTNLSEAEKHHPPRNGWYADVMPHEYPAIWQAIKDCGEHEANFKEENGVRHYESFRAERLK